MMSKHNVYQYRVRGVRTVMTWSSCWWRVTKSWSCRETTQASGWVPADDCDEDEPCRSMTTAKYAAALPASVSWT